MDKNCGKRYTGSKQSTILPAPCQIHKIRMRILPNIILWIIVMLTAAVALSGTVIYRKKTYRNFLDTLK